MINAYCRPWLKFDLSNLNAQNISDAKLYLYHTGEPAGDINATIHFSSDDSWTELGITWNNQPTFGDMIDSKVVDTANTWYYWDVTSQVQTEYNGDKIISLVLKTDTADSLGTFASKEYDSYDPYLKITYTPTLTPSIEEKGEVNLSNFKIYFAEKLHIDEFSAGLLLTTFMLWMFLLPVAVYSRKKLPSLIVSSLVLSFCVSIGWAPYFVLIVIILLVVALWKEHIE